MYVKGMLALIQLRYQAQSEPGWEIRLRPGPLLPGACLPSRYIGYEIVNTITGWDIADSGSK
jgi:hypothetical protein